MFFQLINIAMNNAYILYSESTHYDPNQYSEKAQYLNDVSYRMCRPWAILKYNQQDNRQRDSKVMLRMAFKLSDADLRVPPRAPQPEEAPAPAPEAPAPEQAPAPAPVPAPGPASKATRIAPNHPVGDIPYFGGRWSLIKKSRCNFCGTKSGWRGRLMCESNSCGKSVCPHHSVLLCQVCYQDYLDNR